MNKFINVGIVKVQNGTSIMFNPEIPNILAMPGASSAIPLVSCPVYDSLNPAAIKGVTILMNNTKVKTIQNKIESVLATEAQPPAP